MERKRWRGEEKKRKEEEQLKAFEEKKLVWKANL